MVVERELSIVENFIPLEQVEVVAASIGVELIEVQNVAIEATYTTTSDLWAVSSFICSVILEPLLSSEFVKLYLKAKVSI